MKCVINGHEDAVVVNKINKYCWFHYQIYDSLWNLFKEVFQAYGSLTWGEFLSKILDNKSRHPWKQPITDAGDNDRNSIREIVSYELNLFEENLGKSDLNPKDLIDEIVQTNGIAIVYIDSEVVWGRYREFWPEEVRIKVGTEVTWKNRDNNGLPHRVKFSKPDDHNSESEISSEKLLYGQTFNHVFDMKGIYESYCGLQGQLAMGRVIVT